MLQYCYRLHVKVQGHLRSTCYNNINALCLHVVIFFSSKYELDIKYFYSNDLQHITPFVPHDFMFNDVIIAF